MATFKRRVRDYVGTGIRRHMVCDRNGCVPIAAARAMAEDPDDMREVAEFAALVESELIASGAMCQSGWYSGDYSDVMDLVGRDYKRVEAQRKENWRNRYRRDQVWPTVAQFLRANPQINEAILKTTRHAAYIKDGVAYGVGARKRVMRAFVLA